MSLSMFMNYKVSSGNAIKYVSKYVPLVLFASSSLGIIILARDLNIGVFIHDACLN